MKKVICDVSHYFMENDEIFLISLSKNGHETPLIAYTDIALSSNISLMNNLNIFQSIYFDLLK